LRTLFKSVTADEKVEPVSCFRSGNFNLGFNNLNNAIVAESFNHWKENPFDSTRDMIVNVGIAAA
jgi:hypothetical protein